MTPAEVQEKMLEIEKWHQGVEAEVKKIHQWSKMLEKLVSSMIDSLQSIVAQEQDPSSGIARECLTRLYNNYRIPKDSNEKTTER